jgi:hypothetical protein
MKTLLIGTKRQADKILVESLFNPGGTLTPSRYDLGKYKPDPEKPFVGRSIEVSDNVSALWTEKRRDSDGPYVAVFSLSSNP